MNCKGKKMSFPDQFNDYYSEFAKKAKKKEEPKVEEIKVSDLKIMPDGKIVNKSEGSIDDIYNRHQTTEKKEEGIKKDIPTPMWRRGGNGINKETKFKISKNSPLPNIIKEMIKK